MMNRYREAYRSGRRIAAAGETIRALGYVPVGATVFLTLVVAAEYHGVERLLILVLGGNIAGLLGGLFWLAGIIVGAQGRILKATLDTAVNTSPFFNDDERGQLMSASASEAHDEDVRRRGAARFGLDGPIGGA